MKKLLTILFFLIALNSSAQENVHRFNYFGEKLLFTGKVTPVQYQLTEKKAVENYVSGLGKEELNEAVQFLKNFRASHPLDDWFYYQLIRRTAQQLTPKYVNYEQYTISKWYLLHETDYDSRLALVGNRLLLYVQSNDEVFNVPLLNIDGKQFVCLNIHDFKDWTGATEEAQLINSIANADAKAFHYRITAIPEMGEEPYTEKNIELNINGIIDEYKIKTSNSLAEMLSNYPVMDYSYYFNIPVSNLTYQSIIPVLKEKLKTVKVEDGVRYLLQFSRYAFTYEDDIAIFGKDKRLSPQQIFMYDYSDCDDRVALFYYLVKELYNLPMIALEFPNHVTIAVAMDKPLGKPIVYNGRNYYVCEPTPQNRELEIGQLPAQFKDVAYHVVFEYKP